MPDLARIPQPTGERFVQGDVHRAMLLERELGGTGTDAEHTECFQIAVELSRGIERRRGEGRGLHVGNEVLHQSASGGMSHRDGLG